MRMGLLDDAIREHLDLKRARGGDPAEIERMEREALGPVRREPTIGSARFEAPEAHVRTAYAPEHEDDLTSLDELQDLGYHDSTAPHPDPHNGDFDPHDDLAERQFEHDRLEPFEAPEKAAPPRRRFLRRKRSVSTSDSAPREPGFYEDEPAAQPHDRFEHHEPVPYQEALGHDEPLEDREPSEPETAEDHEAPGPAAASGPPPHLRFDHPPKRPRFTAEPPSLHPEDDEGQPAAPSGLQEDDPEAQETTEFDVQKHIAETRYLPDEDVPRDEAAPADRDAPADHDLRAGQNAPADEDMLEETPEFLQDTPEHDRLWFEQRPPRDFDFDG